MLDWGCKRKKADEMTTSQDSTQKLMPPRYAETMMLDAQNGQMPVLSDVELLARSYLWALECIAAARNGMV